MPRCAFMEEDAAIWLRSGRIPSCRRCCLGLSLAFFFVSGADELLMVSFYAGMLCFWLRQEDGLPCLQTCTEEE
jgi:hypothetical protein